MQRDIGSMVLNNPQTTALKPPLKWAGGKRWLVPYLQPIWHKYQDRRLVEPFCGSLSVTLGLLPDRALLNDVNPHLINFIRWLQRGLEITIPMQNDATLFYTHRQRFNDLIQNNQSDTQEAAELFYYLNRTDFNGLCRFNRSGGFNVPFGRYKTITYAKGFLEYREQLSRWEFQVGDFEQLPITDDDFIYVDPPYDVEFVQYSKDGFTWDEQVRLAQWLSRHKGPVVLSNQATDRIVKLYESMGFSLQYLQSPRRIAANGDRTPAREVLALKGVTR